MLLPLLSVSFVGVTTGLPFAVFGRAPAFDAVTQAVAGAWIGFASGALGAWLVSTTGVTDFPLVVMSHAAAVAGSVAGAVRSHREAPTRPIGSLQPSERP